MTARSIAEAWKMADKIFPTDYYENTVKSRNAGYPIFDSNLGDEYGYICDLGNRLEINLANGKTVNIWVEEPTITLTLTTITEKELVNLAYDTLLDRWSKEYDFLQKNPDSRIARSHIESLSRKLDELHALILELEQN